MSYIRWNESDFYAFWDSADSGDTKETQAIALWHKDHKPREFSLSYKKCLSILESGNFQIIPGYNLEHEEIIKDVISRFIYEVNHDEEFNS